MESGKIDFSGMDYKSPVELFVGKAQVEIENHVVSVVQKMGVNVDKDELLRALRYDREQYEKGYKAGYGRREMEIVRCKDCKHFYEKEDYCNVWEEYDPVEPNGFCHHGEVKDV